MHILLIDDSTAYHDEFAQLLADSGIKFTALDRASNATQGARLLALQAHDIYFIDYRLPGDNGLQLLEAARRAGIIKPIIMLTAFANPLVDAAAEQAGANDFLPKGEFSPPMLARAIRYALRNADMLQAANKAESRFRLAQEAAQIGTWEWDIRKNAYIWSARQRALFGFDPASEDLVPYPTWHQAIHPDDRDLVQAAVANALAGETSFEALFRIIRPEPSNSETPSAVRWISSKGEVQRDASGAPARMIGVSLDVTDQQNALISLRASRNVAVAEHKRTERRFQTYFDSAADCLFHVQVTSDGRFLYESINPAGLAHAGTTLELVRGRTPEEVLGPEIGGAIAQGLRHVVDTGRPYLYQPSFDMGTGAIVYDAIYLPLRDEAGTITGILGTARDITDRRRLEASLHQAQKMEALGQLAGGVAHDFNNLLQGMLGCFEMLAKQATTDKAQRLIVEGRRAVERGTALTARLLAFSRQQPMATEPVDLNAALESMTDMLGRTLGSSIRIGKRLDPELWLATADRNQIELAILNLAINARDAMPLGGSLVMQTRNETFAEPQPDGLMPGDYAAIAIQDSGIGMTPEVLARALDPFFTTKEAGKGTGLGLSMVYGVIRQLGGGVRVESRPNNGTVITLYLPRAHPEVTASVLAPSAPLSGSASILVVDDDPDVRAIITAYATELGHDVVAAANGAEALAVLDAGRPVDLVLADGTLPGMPGSELIAQVRARRPGLTVLLMSGQALHTADDMPVLAKPFGQAAFNNAVAPLLGSIMSSATIIQLNRSATKSD